MSSLRDLKAYVFDLPAHWQKGVLSGLRQLPDGSLTLAPLVKLAPEVLSGTNAWARTVAADGTAYWLMTETPTGTIKLCWLAPGQCTPCEIQAPAGLRSSPRLVADRWWLWAFKPGSACLLRYGLDTFEADPVDAPAGGFIQDIAGDGRDGLWLLQTDAEKVRLSHVNAQGRMVVSKLFEELGQMQGLAFVKAQADCLGLLSADGERLILLDPGNLQVLSDLALNEVWPGFTASALSHLSVLVAAASGMLRMPAASDADATEAEGVFFSPRLYSPENATLRGWLRAEVMAFLPKGATLSVTVWGSTDKKLCEQVDSALQDPNHPPAVRQQKARCLIKLKGHSTGPFVFDARKESSGPNSFQVPLFDRQEPWLWLELRLGAAHDGRLPVLHTLRVLYPEVTLAEHVPAIFRGGIAGQDTPTCDSTGFFRQLIGILETTTQGLDQTIAQLGDLVDPETAPAHWLDVLARWLDLPWDDALPDRVKRAMLLQAGPLLAQRGTRSGLELLLRQIVPGGRFKVVDVGVDIGLARLNSGVRLPTLLTGLPADAAALSRKAVLGQARLGLTGPDFDSSGASRFAGLVRIDLYASAADRSALEPLLPGLLAAVMPVAIKPLIRWREGADPRFDNRLDLGFRLDDFGPRKLSVDARLGWTTLAPARRRRLPADGLPVGFRLN